MDWFRWHHGTVSDPKWRVIGLDSGQPVHAVMAIWSAMLECASQAEDRGRLSGWNDRVIAIALDLSSDQVSRVRQAMQGLVLDGDRLAGWDKRQPKREREDNSADRVRGYRERVREGGGTVGGYLKHHAHLMKRDDGKCIYCAAGENLCIDHMVPVAQGGDDQPDNLAIACKACNSGKSGRTPEQAGYKIIHPAAAAAHATSSARHAMSRHVTPRLDKSRVEEKESLAVEVGDLDPPRDRLAFEGKAIRLGAEGLAECRKVYPFDDLPGLLRVYDAKFVKRAEFPPLSTVLGWLLIDARKRPSRGLDPPKTGGAEDEEQWRTRLCSWTDAHRGGPTPARWIADAWGPLPGQPGCRAPPRLLVEFGLIAAA